MFARVADRDEAHEDAVALMNEVTRLRAVIVGVRIRIEADEAAGEASTTIVRHVLEGIS